MLHLIQHIAESRRRKSEGCRNAHDVQKWPTRSRQSQKTHFLHWQLSNIHAKLFVQRSLASGRIVSWQRTTILRNAFPTEKPWNQKYANACSSSTSFFVVKSKHNRNELKKKTPVTPYRMRWFLIAQYHVVSISLHALAPYLSCIRRYDHHKTNS